MTCNVPIVYKKCFESTMHTVSESYYEYIAFTSCSNWYVGILYHESILNFQTVASKLHNTEVEMEILQTKEECDHVQFLITEKNNTGQRQNDQTAEVETLSQGYHRDTTIIIILIRTKGFLIVYGFYRSKK